MAPNPIPMLIILLCTVAFEGLVFGKEMAGKSFDFGGCIENPDATPAPGQACEQPERDCSGFDGIGCFFDWVVGLFKTLGAVVTLMFKLFTFDIPGVPWYIRYVLTGVTVATFALVLAAFVRGN